MKLGARRVYFVLMGFIGLGLIALGISVYFASTILTGKSGDVRAARLENLVLEERQRLLSKANQDIQKYRDLAVVARDIVPQDKDQAQTVREIAKLASRSGVILGGITFPSSNLGDSKAPARTQVQPATGIPGVFVLPITVRSDSQISSAFSNFVKFLDGLERNRRTALVTSINLQPDDNNPSNIFFSLTIEEYIKP